MIIAAIIFRLHAPWVHSLKEKRMVVKSLVTQLQNRFHVSAAETDEQDTHQIIVIGAAAIVPHNAMADRLVNYPPLKPKGWKWGLETESG